MEHQLCEHDDRPGWEGESTAYLVRRMREEYEELCTALIVGGDVPGEAADVANFAMMIADNWRRAAGTSV
jgi:hypothetical protein